MKIDEIDVCISALVAGVGDSGCVRREGWSNADGLFLRDLTLVGAIVVREVDFLGSGSVAHERKLGSSDAVLTGQRLDDVVGEFVGG